MLKVGLTIDEGNEDIKAYIEECVAEIKFDKTLPDDHPLKSNFNKMFDWMKEGGAEFDKLKLRYYTESFRGIHAAQEIKNGETLLYVPKS